MCFMKPTKFGYLWYSTQKKRAVEMSKTLEDGESAVDTILKYCFVGGWGDYNEYHSNFHNRRQFAISHNTGENDMSIEIYKDRIRREMIRVARDDSFSSVVNPFVKARMMEFVCYDKSLIEKVVTYVITGKMPEKCHVTKNEKESYLVKIGVLSENEIF